jgi:hypothetical protein
MKIGATSDQCVDDTVLEILRHPDDDDPLTLQEACDLIFNGNIAPSTLRKEHERGNLVIEKIGRRQFVTRASINEMRNRCRVVPTEKAPAYGCSQNVPMPTVASNDPGGSSETDRSNAALGALQMTLQELRKPSRIT